jgi:hypothetical protein
MTDSLQQDPHQNLVVQGQQQWQCKQEANIQDHCQVIKKGEVYDWKDFCRRRAPIWYQAQIDRLVQACVRQGFFINFIYGNASEAEWEADHVWWQVQNAARWGTPEHVEITYRTIEKSKCKLLDKSKPAAEAAVAIAAAEAAAKPAPAPCRVQPSRTSKRKADTEGAIAPRKKKTKTEEAKPVPGSPYGDYTITEEEFRRTLRDHTVHHGDMALLHATEWFRSRVMAEVVNKVNAAWNAVSAGDGLGLVRQHRCALRDLATEPPWEEKKLVPDYEAQETSHWAFRPDPPSIPVADMLSSPSLGHWPKVLNTGGLREPPTRAEVESDDLPLEKVLKRNVVEIAGLKFMVDLCETEEWATYTGTRASPRIWML